MLAGAASEVAVITYIPVFKAGKKDILNRVLLSTRSFRKDGLGILYLDSVRGWNFFIGMDPIDLTGQPKIFLSK